MNQKKRKKNRINRSEKNKKDEVVSENAENLETSEDAEVQEAVCDGCEQKILIDAEMSDDSDKIISLEEKQAESEKTPEKNELEKLQKERDEYLDLCQRTKAEFDNFRKRIAREKENEKILLTASIIKEFITPVDDLDRALQEADKNPDFETLFTGLKIVRDHLWKTLGATGFEKIEASSGTTFDPNFHEAMMQIPHPEIPLNKIVEEFAPGYKIGELVLRPSKVGVSAGSPAPAESASEDTAKEDN